MCIGVAPFQLISQWQHLENSEKKDSVKATCDKSWCKDVQYFLLSQQ